MRILLVIIFSLIECTPTKKRVKLEDAENKVTPCYIDKVPAEVLGLIADNLSQIDVTFLRRSCSTLRDSCELDLEKLEPADMKYVKDYEALDKLRSPLQLSEEEVEELLKLNLEKENYRNLRYIFTMYGSMACCGKFLWDQILGRQGLLNRLLEGGSIDFFKSIQKYGDLIDQLSFVYACESGRMDVFELFLEPVVNRSLLNKYGTSIMWKKCTTAAVENRHSNIYNYLVDNLPETTRYFNIHEYLYEAAAELGVDELVEKLYATIDKEWFINSMHYLCSKNKVELITLVKKRVDARNVRSLILTLLKSTDPSPEIIDILEKGRPLIRGALEAAAAYGRVNYITWTLRNRKVSEYELKKAINEAILKLQSQALLALVNNREDSFNVAFEFLSRYLPDNINLPTDFAPMFRTFLTGVNRPFVEETVWIYLNKAVWSNLEVDILFNFLSPDARTRLAYWTGQDGSRGIYDGTKLEAFYHDERSLEAFLKGSLHSQSSQSLDQICSFKSFNDPQGPSLIPRLVKLIGLCSLINSDVLKYLWTIHNTEIHVALRAQLNAALVLNYANFK